MDVVAHPFAPTALPSLYFFDCLQCQTPILRAYHQVEGILLWPHKEGLVHLLIFSYFLAFLCYLTFIVGVDTIMKLGSWKRGKANLHLGYIKRILICISRLFWCSYLSWMYMQSWIRCHLLLKPSWGWYSGFRGLGFECHVTRNTRGYHRHDIPWWCSW